VILPQHIDMPSTGQIREELLTLISRGTAALIADMTTTLSCEHAGADAVARACQRVLANSTQLRLVATAHIARRVLSLNGLDRTVTARVAGWPAGPAGQQLPYEMTDVARLGQFSLVRRGTVSGSVSSGYGGCRGRAGGDVVEMLSSALGRSGGAVPGRGAGEVGAMGRPVRRRGRDCCDSEYR
jgi:hypothetical protein